MSYRYYATGQSGKVNLNVWLFLQADVFQSTRRLSHLFLTQMYVIFVPVSVILGWVYPFFYISRNVCNFRTSICNTVWWVYPFFISRNVCNFRTSICNTWMSLSFFVWEEHELPRQNSPRLLVSFNSNKKRPHSQKYHRLLITVNYRLVLKILV